MLHTIFSLISWWLIRLIAILIAFGIFYDIEIMILIYTLILIHLKLGLETILSDYIHNKFTHYIFLFFLRLLSLEMAYFFLDLVL